MDIQAQVADKAVPFGLGGVVGHVTRKTHGQRLAVHAHGQAVLARGRRS